MKKVNIIVSAAVAIFSMFFFVSHVEFSKEKENTSQNSNVQTEYEVTEVYVLNKRSKKIHKSNCGTARLIKEENKLEYKSDIQILIDIGYSRCGNCFR